MENNVMEMMEANLENPEYTVVEMEPDYSCNGDKKAIAIAAVAGVVTGVVIKKAAPIVKNGVVKGLNAAKGIFKKKTEEVPEEETNVEEEQKEE